MKRSRTNVSRELKERITLESLEPGCDLVSLARKYNLSSCTVDKWRRNYQKQRSENTLTTSDQQFIELQLPRKEKTITLQKVELLFDNHKCCILDFGQKDERWSEIFKFFLLNSRLEIT